VTRPAIQPPSSRLRARADALLDTVEGVAARAGAPALRVALGIIMLWFGLPKTVPGGSPAEDLAVATVDRLTAGVVTGDTARLAVAGLEIAIGIALLVGRWMPLVLLVVLGHMAGTAAPLVLFPEVAWRSTGVGTLEGQYILKNLLIVAGVVVLAGAGLRRRATAVDAPVAVAPVATVAVAPVQPAATPHTVGARHRSPRLVGTVRTAHPTTRGVATRR
jgi:uncharacterized membrane protein YphA (DoxX/SURF4 family)